MKKTAFSSIQFSVTEARESHEQPVREIFHSGDIQTTSALREETNIPKGRIIEELQKSPLISVHINAVKNWSEIVFGEKNVFDTKIKEILNNPSVSNKILWAISLNPQSIHKLAGKNICGFNNRARKNATKSLPLLHEAIYGLAKTSERMKNNIISQMEKNGREKPMESEDAVKSLLRSYHRAKKTCLSDYNIIDIFAEDPFIKKCQEEIQYWCIIVYGHPNVLAKKIAEIQRNPLVVSDLLEDLANIPYRYHSLVGFGMCCFKNEERRRAEVSVQHLHECVQFFSEVVKSAKELIEMEHLERQKYTDRSQNQTPETLAENIQYTRAEHHPAPQQGPSQRMELRRMALTM